MNVSCRYTMNFLIFSGFRHQLQQHDSYEKALIEIKHRSYVKQDNSLLRNATYHVFSIMF